MAERFGVLSPKENAGIVFPSASLLPVPGVSSRVFDTGLCRVPIPGGCTSHSTDFGTWPCTDPSCGWRWQRLVHAEDPHGMSSRPALLSLCPVRWEGYAQGVIVALAWVPEQRHSPECSPQSEGKSSWSADQWANAIDVCYCRSVSRLVVFNSDLARFLCLWNSPGKNTGVGCHLLLQEIFPSQGLNLCLLNCRQILSCLNYQGSPGCKATTTFLIIGNNHGRNGCLIQMLNLGWLDVWNYMLIYMVAPCYL